MTAVAFFAAVGLAFAHAAGILDLTDIESAALGVTIAAFGISLIWPLAAEAWREVPDA